MNFRSAKSGALTRHEKKESVNIRSRGAKVASLQTPFENTKGTNRIRVSPNLNLVPGQAFLARKPAGAPGGKVLKRSGVSAPPQGQQGKRGRDAERLFPVSV